MNPYIENYFKITGRPISTMSVDEFIKLENAWRGTIITPSTSIVVNESEVKAERDGAQNKAKDEKYIPIVDSLSTKGDIKEKSNKSALMLLKSVQG